MQKCVANIVQKVKKRPTLMMMLSIKFVHNYHQLMRLKSMNRHYHYHPRHRQAQAMLVFINLFLFIYSFFFSINFRLNELSQYSLSSYLIIFVFVSLFDLQYEPRATTSKAIDTCLNEQIDVQPINLSPCTETTEKSSISANNDEKPLVIL